MSPAFGVNRKPWTLSKVLAGADMSACSNIGAPLKRPKHSQKACFCAKEGPMSKPVQIDSAPIKSDRLLMYPELKSIFGVPYSRMHLWRLERKALFPQRIALSVHRSAWVAGEVAEWVASQAAKRTPIASPNDG